MARVHWAQWTDNNRNIYFRDGTSIGTGPGYTYYAYWLSGTKQFRFMNGSTTLWTVAGGWTPSAIQAYGETHTPRAQMPGDTSNKVLMSGVKYIKGSDTTWTSINTAAGVNNSTWYGATKNSSTSYYIWDKFCSSAGGN